MGGDSTELLPMPFERFCQNWISWWLKKGLLVNLGAAWSKASSCWRWDGSSISEWWCRVRSVHNFNLVVRLIACKYSDITIYSKTSISTKILFSLISFQIWLVFYHIPLGMVLLMGSLYWFVQSCSEPILPKILVHLLISRNPFTKVTIH